MDFLCKNKFNIKITKTHYFCSKNNTIFDFEKFSLFQSVLVRRKYSFDNQTF